MKIFRLTAHTVVFMSLMAFANSGTAKAGIIETVSGWNGTNYVAAFGEEASATYGQTFKVVGPDTVLNRFTLYVNELDGSPVDFRFNVMQWDAGSNMATGGVLFTSDMVSTTNNGGSGGFEEFAFDTGNLNLNAGTDYIGLISVSQGALVNTIDEESGVGSLLNESAYADGSFVWQDNGNDSSAWTTQSWNSNGGFGDLAFKAEFSAPSNPVPEPASFAIFGTLCLIAGAGRRRRKA